MGANKNVDGLILDKLATLTARVTQLQGDLRRLLMVTVEQEDRRTFGNILVGLKHRGVITTEDVDRLGGRIKEGGKR